MAHIAKIFQCQCHLEHLFPHQNRIFNYLLIQIEMLTMSTLRGVKSRSRKNVREKATKKNAKASCKS